MSDRLNDKIAIVTGAGSRGPGLGNGKATAILFAREGARVLCVDQVRERAEETVGIIRGEGHEAQALAADVTRASDCAAMVAAAERSWGGLDILHNNVGIESRKDLLDTEEDEWDQVLAVDLKSMFLATRAAAPALAKRGGCAVAFALIVAAGCAPTTEIEFERAPGRGEPLQGRIWDVAAGAFVDPQTLVQRLAASRYVLLGERHDNPEHHTRQAQLVRDLVAAGRRPAVGFEMISTDDGPAIARYLIGSPKSAARLGAAVNWPRPGWPDWRLYE